jgi:hypothetical protein
MTICSPGATRGVAAEADAPPVSAKRLARNIGVMTARANLPRIQVSLSIALPGLGEESAKAGHSATNTLYPVALVATLRTFTLSAS